MERIIKNLENLEFSHFVITAAEEAILGHAQEGGNYHRFLIGTVGNWVKRYHNEQWQELTEGHAELVKTRAESYYGRVPTIRINWTLEGI